MFNFWKKIGDSKKKAKKTSDSVDSFYLVLGEEKGIKELVTCFYSTMATNPAYRECLELHSLTSEHQIKQNDQDKLFYFLSGWLGGPPLYMQKIGAPRMRMRHGHLKINTKVADQWLSCMHESLMATFPKMSNEHHESLMNSFKAIALRIINSD